MLPLLHSFVFVNFFFYNNLSFFKIRSELANLQIVCSFITVWASSLRILSLLYFQTTSFIDETSTCSFWWTRHQGDRKNKQKVIFTPNCNESNNLRQSFCFQIVVFESIWLKKLPLLVSARLKVLRKSTKKRKKRCLYEIICILNDWRLRISLKY